MTTHIKILNNQEVNSFESPPEFSQEARMAFFEIPKWCKQLLVSIRTPTNKTGLVLQLGYFTAVTKFFAPSKFHPKDVEFVANKLDLEQDSIEFKNYTSRSRNSRRHQEIIFDNLGFQKFGGKSKKILDEEASSLCSNQMKPRLMFISLVEFLRKRKIEVPSYYALSEIITNALLKYEKNLWKLLEKHITDEGKYLLDELLEVINTGVEDGRELKIKRYRITSLKRSNQSTQPVKIKRNIDDLLFLRKIFEKLEIVIDNLDLAPEVIRYFAQTVVKYQVFQTIRSERKKYLYLVAFVMHQYYQMNDYLVEILMHVVQTWLNTSQREHKEIFYETRKDRHQAIHDVSKTMGGHVETLCEVAAIVHDQQKSCEEKIFVLKSLISDEKNLEYPELQKQISLLEEESNRIVNEDDYYDILEEKSRKIQNRVSKIVKCLYFDSETSNELILKAISQYKQTDGNFGDRTSLEIFEPKEQKVIYSEQGKIREALYKVLLYREVALAVKYGALNLSHSYKYRAFDNYLIPQQIWFNRRSELTERACLSNFLNLKKLMDHLKKVVHEQYQTTNENINTGKNKYAKFDQKGKLIISTPKVEKKLFNMVIGNLLPKNRLISLFEILSTVNRHSHFLDCFDHWKIKHNREKPADKTFFAGIIGLGCNLGIKRIGKISRGINQNILEHTVNWYFSVDGINLANNKILEFTSQLDLPKVFKKNQDVTHTSSDGKKFSIGVDSLNSNYSYKYFGKGKGVSVCGFIDEAQRLFYSTVISPAEREAAYVIDGLMNNDVIKSDIHSTDTHGFSEIIFAITFLLGISFAPRIKNFLKQTLSCLGSKSGLKKRGYKIFPKEKINIKIIEDNWENILRFIATIKLKEATASQLLHRLSSYSKQHPLYQALQEFGKIIKTSFLLSYIDDVELRQAIEKVLNKMENVNKFGGAVFHGKNQEFQQATKENQLIAEGCKRLIENAIICWNYLYLSQLICDTKSEKERENLVSVIQNGSVVTWQHINLLGEYDFSEEILKDSFDFKIPDLLALRLV